MPASAADDDTVPVAAAENLAPEPQPGSAPRAIGKSLAGAPVTATTKSPIDSPRHGRDSNPTIIRRKKDTTALVEGGQAPRLTPHLFEAKMKMKFEFATQRQLDSLEVDSQLVEFLRAKVELGDKHATELLALGQKLKAGLRPHP